MPRDHFKKIKLKNGLRVLLIPRPQSLAASVLILVEAGSEYETKKINGLSHFLEHMMFKGTVNRPKPGMIAEELAALGAQSNAFTGQEYTGYWAKAESHKVEKILEIVSDLYLNPIFNPEEIEKERGVIIEEINMYEDTPMRSVQELFTSLLYGDQPAGWDIAGKKEIIRKLSRNDFINYRRVRYVAPRTLVVVAGNFNPQKIERQIRELFGGLKKRGAPSKPKTKERQTKPGLLLKHKSSDQSHLVLGARAFDIFDKRRYALQVLSDVLGGGMSSRLFRRVREELGAAYYVNAGADLYLDHGYLAVSAGVDHGKIEKVIEAVMSELLRIKRELVGEKELQKSKDHLVGNLILDLETADELAAFYGSQEILTASILPPGKLIDKIYGVRAEEIRSVANSILKNNRLNLSIIGPYKESKAVSFKRLLTL
ncbi:MAG: insulinase family protein [Candidatus Liptonbacteria bacterium]|nr:insulinase family protein [Candidatus Liptonbacteria bacterium]